MGLCIAKASNVNMLYCWIACGSQQNYNNTYPPVELTSANVSCHENVSDDSEENQHTLRIPRFIDHNCKEAQWNFDI